MIQGGDPEGTVPAEKSIWGDSFEDEFDQKLINLTGALSMANSGVNTNGSQFFINNTPAVDFSAYEDAFEKQKADIKKPTSPTGNSSTALCSSRIWASAFTGKRSPTRCSIFTPSTAATFIWTARGGCGGHTVFGQVFDGMDVVDAISKVEVSNSKPVTDVVINSIEVTEYAG